MKDVFVLLQTSHSPGEMIIEGIKKEFVKSIMEGTSMKPLTYMKFRRIRNLTK